MTSAEPNILNFLIDESDDAWKSQSRTRAALLRRLQDVVSLPSSQISPQERHMAADLLIEMLKDCETSLKVRCSERLALLSEVPAMLLRVLSRDDFEVARPLLEISNSYNDSDLISIITSNNIPLQHLLLISKRRHVSETVSDALVNTGIPDVIEQVLMNENAKFSHPSLDIATSISKTHNKIVELLLKRRELRPSQALTMFWWASSESRKLILQRFAVERLTMLDAVKDIYSKAAEENWQDPLVRKSLQFIERRQRNRGAALKSPHGSLEGAIDALERQFDTELFKEISFLSGVKPACGAQILSDPGGEAIAVLCKSVGLKRRDFRRLWKGLKRPIGTEENEAEAFVRASFIYDTLSTNKAQTVVRYWNWSLTSAMSPIIAAKLDGESDEFSVATQVSKLVFGKQN